MSHSHRGGCWCDYTAKEQAGLELGSYEPKVILADVIESVILKNLGIDNLVCLGVSEQLAVSEILWGSLQTELYRRRLETLHWFAERAKHTDQCVGGR